MLPPTVPLDEFLRRLALLEEWLWGPGWRRLGLARPPRVEAVAQRVLELSDLYTTERGNLAAADAASHLLAKTHYFLCSDTPKVHLVLAELASRDDVAEERSGTLRVIDAGAGVGASTAGLLLGLDRRSVQRVRVHALDADPAALRAWRAAAQQAAAIAGVELEAHALRADLRELDPAELKVGYDLVVAQAVLNELYPAADAAAAAARADWMERWLRRGVAVVIEPALRATTRPLHAARDLLLARGVARVLAPCPHQGACPMLAGERDWCHEVRTLPPTPRVAEVQALTRRRDERTKFSFVAMAPAEAAPPNPWPATAGRLVSDALASKGKVERDLCAGSGALVRLRLLDRERTAANETLATAARGTLVRIEGETASLPRVGRETAVEALRGA